MTQDDINKLWAAAYVNGMLPFEQREKFARLVAAEKDKEIKRLQDMLYELLGELTALRAEKQMRGYIKQLKDSAAETTIDVSGTEEEQPR